MQIENVDLDRVTAGLTTKSDKIRALSQHGVGTAEIARYLGVRYQHARNVLVQSGLHRTKGQASGPARAEEGRKSAWVQVDKDGRVPVPHDLLRAAGLETDARVYVGLTADGLELLSQQAALVRAQRIAAPFRRPGVSVVDEFIAERRHEAESE